MEGSEARTMAEILATKRPLPERESPGTPQAARAGALFLSALQPSGSPTPDQIRRAVTTTLQRLGVLGCAAQVAGEFGDHPDTAAARMSWALAAAGSAYPAPSMTRAPSRQPLAFAS
jgi:hypothetical protein